MSGFLADLGLALRIGLRDLRGAGRSFVVLLGALMLGVAIIAAVGILNQGVQTALERDARLLLGGDLELEQANAPVPAVDLERIVPPGGSLSAQVRLSTLAAADDRTVRREPEGGRRRLPPPGRGRARSADAPGRGAGQWGRRGRASATGPPRAGRRRQREGGRDQHPDQGRAAARAGPGRRPVQPRATPARRSSHPRRRPGAAARRPGALRVQGDPAGGNGRGAVRRRPAAELAGCRLARAQPARRAAPDHPRHRPAGDLPDAGGPHRAAQRRPGHRADHRDAPGTADRDHRHAQEPGCVRRARCSRSTWRR